MPAGRSIGLSAVTYLASELRVTGSNVNRNG